MKPAFLFSTSSFLLVSAEQDIAEAEAAPPSGEQPTANEQPFELPGSSERELRGQAALGASLVGLLAFTLGFLAVGWILSFVGFIAASLVLMDHSRGRYWPAHLALCLSLIFVVGLLAFALIYG
ncbi:MAG: hypothetical protein GVY26_17300 [Bacteroidetes bacterium]|jgi:hypothetical protein|nr:hypothetical protein [Bacteroidota bacterium]